MKVLAVVLFVACAANALQADLEFETFKIRFAKKYETEEHETRRAIFAENLKYIKRHNAEAEMGMHTYHLGINKFADLTNAEYRQMHLSKPKIVNKRPGKTVDTSLLADEVDWRTEGYVTPIKDQGQCGSCWTFSAVVSMEGAHFKKEGELLSLSEQQLVDCVHPSTDGCQGGNMDDAFEYVLGTGSNSESSYSYHARDGYCKFDANSVVATFSNYEDVDAFSESALQEAVATVGPVSIGIDASHISFQLYSHGVYMEPACSEYQLDHGVAAVGYGSLGGQDHWIVKNSWGTGWGMDGYIMMARNEDNQCGVASDASYIIA